MIRLVLWDWNGTILDDTVAVWNKARVGTFRHFGVENPPSIEEHFHIIESSGDYLAAYRAAGITAEREELIAIYESLYTAHAGDALLMAGAQETLAELADRRITQGLITANQAKLVLPLLAKFDVGRFFSHASFHAIKKNEVIQALLSAAGILPQECCFVGDAPSDIRHANRAGVVSIAYLDPREDIPQALVLAAHPRHVVERLDAVLPLVS